MFFRFLRPTVCTKDFLTQKSATEARLRGALKQIYQKTQTVIHHNVLQLALLKKKKSEIYPRLQCMAYFDFHQN